MTILITGGGGYIGTLLTNKLIEQNKKVRVIDNFWFGNYLKKNKNLSIIKKDILNCSSKDLKGVKKLFTLHL